jgi:hypothetical protein
MYLWMSDKIGWCIAFGYSMTDTHLHGWDIGV